MTTYIDGFNATEELVVSVEDELWRELPLDGLLVLEVVLQFGAVLLVDRAESSENLDGDLNLLDRLLYLPLEDLCGLQVVSTLKNNIIYHDLRSCRLA